jgi:hypothetical protein
MYNGGALKVMLRFHEKKRYLGNKKTGVLIT